MKNKSTKERQYATINTTTIKSMSIFNFLDQADFNTEKPSHRKCSYDCKRFGTDQDIECAEYVLKRHEVEQIYDRGFKKL